MKKLSREGECRRIYLAHLHGAWRKRRDGKLYKSFWVSKGQTSRIVRAKAKNRASFYKTESGPVKGEWRGIISHEGTLMIVQVEVSQAGSSKVTFTKEN